MSPVSSSVAPQSLHPSSKQSCPVVSEIPLLLESAQSALNEFPPNCEKAVQLYMQILELDPNCVPALDGIGELLANLGDSTRAVEALTRSVQIAPEEGPLKYFYLGELLAGTDSLSAYRKCIVLLTQAMSNELADDMSNKEIRDRLVCVHCLVGELYMTDLAFDPDAETECEKAFLAALDVNPASIEALNGMGTFHRMRLDIEEAKKFCLSAFERLAQYVDNQDDEAGEPEDDIDAIAPFACRMRLAENLVELQCVDESLALLSTILEEDEEDIQAWFLTSCCHMVANDQKEALECAKQAKKLVRKNKASIDPSVVQQWTKTLTELEQRIRTKTGSNSITSDMTD